MTAPTTTIVDHTISDICRITSRPNWLSSLLFLSLILTIFTIPWRDLLFLHSTISVGQGLGVLTAFIWLLNKIHEPQIKLNKPVIISILFLTWTTVSLLWSPDVLYSTTYLTRLAYGVAFFIIITDTISKEWELLLAMKFYVLGAAVTSGRILLDLIYTLLHQDQVLRIYVNGFNINRAAGMVLFSLPLASLLAYRSDERLIESAYILIILAGMLSIIASGSRQAIVSLVPLTVLLAYWTSARFEISFILTSTVAVFSLASLSLLALISSIKIFDRIKLIIEVLREGDIGPRGEIWGEAIAAWSNNPILGTGYRAFAATSGRIEHNTFLGILTGTGIIGIFLFFYLCSSLIRPNFSDFDEYSILWLFGAITYFPILIFNDWEFEPTFWLILGLVSGSIVLKNTVSNNLDKKRR